MARVDSLEIPRWGILGHQLLATVLGIRDRSSELTDTNQR